MGSDLAADQTTLLVKDDRFDDFVEVSGWGVATNGSVVFATVGAFIDVEPTLPGVYSAMAEVNTQRRMPDGAMREDFSAVSNATAFLVAPSITAVSPPNVNGEVDITGSVFQHPDLKATDIVLYIGSERLDPRVPPAALLPGQFEVLNATTVRFRFPVPKVVSGTQVPLRLMIRGAEKCAALGTRAMTTRAAATQTRGATRRSDADRVIERFRLLATLRAAWLRKLWSEEAPEQGGRSRTVKSPYISKGATAPRRKAGWQRSQESLSQTRARLDELTPSTEEPGRLAELIRVFGLDEAESVVLEGCIALALEPRRCAVLPLICRITQGANTSPRSSLRSCTAPRICRYRLNRRCFVGKSCAPANSAPANLALSHATPLSRHGCAA